MKKIVITLTLFFLVLSSLIAFLLYNRYIWFNNPSYEKYPVRGIDISNYQGDIDWEKLKDDKFEFIFIKATEGKDYKDKYFEKNWENAKSINIKRGAYHFFTFRSSGKDQADNFINSVPNESDSLPPVIDIEFGGNSKTILSKEEFLKEATDFITKIEERYNKKPILYVTHESYNKYIIGNFNEYNIWIRDVIKYPRLKDKNEWLFWQYSNREKVNGINGFIDMNVFNGNKSEFEQYISQK